MSAARMFVSVCPPVYSTPRKGLVAGIPIIPRIIATEQRITVKEQQLIIVEAGLSLLSKKKEISGITEERSGTIEEGHGYVIIAEETVSGITGNL